MKEKKKNVCISLAHTHRHQKQKARVALGRIASLNGEEETNIIIKKKIQNLWKNASKSECVLYTHSETLL